MSGTPSLNASPDPLEHTARVGLCMIVKNEAHVILRCLDSVRPLVDFVLVEDTGSSDGTQDVIRRWLQEHHIPGEVVDVPWQDFAYNRSHALQTLRGRGDVDYAFIIDADDVLVLQPGLDVQACKRTLKADLIDLDIHYGSLRYRRPHLLRNALPFRFRGVLHEYVEIAQNASGREVLSGAHIQIAGGGGRSRDDRKFEKDVMVLRQALSTETDAFLRSRYTFYLAQSLGDSGQLESALAAYLQRAEMGYWDEEVYVSLYRAGQLREKLSHSFQEVVNTYLRATAIQPARAEALHAASRLCRLTKRFNQGFWFAKRGLTSEAVTGLFVEPWIYEYGMLDELAVNAYWSGRFEECKLACERLLGEGRLPPGMRHRVQENLRFAQDRLAGR